MGVTAGIFLASILLREMRYLVYLRYLWYTTTRMSVGGAVVSAWKFIPEMCITK
jgi:uncharacterized membrane protein (GlpM family)